LGSAVLTGGLPEFGTAFGGSFRWIVQTPRHLMFTTWVRARDGQRNIRHERSPHLPARHPPMGMATPWRWEGGTLIVDVTNFSPKTDFRARARTCTWVRKRWTAGPGTPNTSSTIEDPRCGRGHGPSKQDFTKQSDEQNRIYYEPRCIEGNYALPGCLCMDGARESAHVRLCGGRGHPIGNPGQHDGWFRAR